MTATTFSEWLLREIATRDWSMRELARRAGVSHVTISKVIAEKCRPSAELCIRLAQALRLSPEAVLREGGYLRTLAAAEDATLLRIKVLLLGLAGTARGQERLAMLETMIEALYAEEYP